MKEYSEFLDKKQLLVEPSGFIPTLEFNENLYEWQKDIVKWALIRGKACLFEDCGLGKTIQQLEWAFHVHKFTKKPILIVAPLAVNLQTQKEGDKFGYSVNLAESKEGVVNGINITNYEKIHLFDCSVFGGVVLDESSILKNFSGYYRNLIIESFKGTPYKLACTATPAPNDYMELGSHSEFIGAMTSQEMLAMFFINDMSGVGEWRLKKHAKEVEFWQWVCSWACTLSTPSDLGYDDKDFILPELRYHEVILPAVGTPAFGFFALPAQTMDERRKVRKESITERCEKAAEIINITDSQWIVWCGLNTESELLTKLIENSTQVTGSDKNDYKANTMLGFSKGEVQRIITKPKIAGFGMNWQNCNKMAFVGLSDSWEQLYQAVRRSYRFGQTRPVDVYIIIEEREGKVLANIKRKDKQAKHMIDSMVKYTAEILQKELKNNKTKKQWNEKTMELPKWILEN